MYLDCIEIKAKNVNELIGFLKEGLPAVSFDKLRECLNISDHKLSQIIQIPKRTMDRRRREGKLRQDESERVFRLASVYSKAREVFENNKDAEKWLKTPARGLGRKIPLEYADTELGANEVIQLLGRIEHGVFPG
jgi:putative toxin-antitoxin system antitoxin component (TIGR02293 family)